MNRDKILNLAKKVKALADKGSDGEKNAARDRLTKICQKYNISEDELIVLEEVNDFFIYVSDPLEKELLKNVVCMVLSVKGFRWKERNNCIKLKMTSSDFGNVNQAFEHYRDMFSNYKKHLLDAIIIKNDIYCKKVDPSPNSINPNLVTKQENVDKSNSTESTPIKISEKLVRIANIVDRNVWRPKRNNLT